MSLRFLYCYFHIYENSKLLLLKKNKITMSLFGPISHFDWILWTNLSAKPTAYISHQAQIPVP